MPFSISGLLSFRETDIGQRASFRETDIGQRAFSPLARPISVSRNDNSLDMEKGMH
jgi:hypothetical protein